MQASASASKEFGVDTEESRTKKGIERLYEIDNRLNSSEDKESKELLFKELLARVPRSQREQRLACKCIAKFIEHYPHLEENAINVLFDLCEDPDTSLRKLAMRELVTICRKLLHLASSISYVFVQMLQSKDATDVVVANDCLQELITINADLSLVGMFAQIKDGDYTVIDCCLKFLQTHMKTFGAHVRTLNVQTRLFKEIGKSITVLDNMEHFKMAMEVLGSTVFVKTIEGNKRIVEMVEKLLGVGESGPSLAITNEAIAKLLVCSDFLFPFFHGRSNSASLFTHYCLRILPSISEAHEEAQLSVVRMAVDLFLYFENMDYGHGKLCLEAMFKILDAALVEPPSNPKDRTMPGYQFSFMEGILYIVHRLGAMHPNAFKELTELGSFANLKMKLQYMLRAVAAYKIKIKADLRKLTAEERRGEDFKITCLRTLHNIGIMTTELWQKKVSEEEIRISWKARAFNESKETKAEYTHKATRIYQPPNGKYSSQAGSFPGRSSRVKRTNISDENGVGPVRDRHMQRRN